MAALDLREMTFQNVVDQILKPNGVKVGGYPEDMFLEISDKEKETYLCNICFLVLKEARECSNKHHFCHTCIFAWALTYGPNSQKCPVCRNPQQRYRESIELNKIIGDKRVQCQEEGCTYKSPLKFFLYHSHGKERFSNAHVDLESLRPERTSATSLFFLPQIGTTGGQRISQMRSSLEQGRMMIHQMVFLLQLEMQLRQRSMVSMSMAQNASNRLARLDEVLALNEQLNEVGTILTSMMSEPLIRSTRRHQDDEESSTSMSGRSQSEASGSGRGLFNSRDYVNPHEDESDSDSESDESEASTVISRIAAAPQIRSSNNNGVRTSNLTTTANLQTIQRVTPNSINSSRPSAATSEIEHFADETTTVTVSSSLNTVNPRRMLDNNRPADNTEARNENEITSQAPSLSTGTSNGIQAPTRRVLARQQVQNTIHSASNSETVENTTDDTIQAARSQDLRPSSTLPSIEQTHETDTDPNLPQGSDAYSRTIRELYRSADNLEQSEHVTARQNSISEVRNSGALSMQPSATATSRPNSVCRRETLVAGRPQSNVRGTSSHLNAPASSPNVSSSGNSVTRSQARGLQTTNEVSVPQNAEVQATHTRGTENHNGSSNSTVQTRNRGRINQSIPAVPANDEVRSTENSNTSVTTRTFAPQRRFRRQESDSGNGGGSTITRRPSNSESSRNKAPARRSVSNSRSKSERGKQNITSRQSHHGRSVVSSSTDPPANLTREADSGNVESNGPPRPQRTRRMSTERPRGPATAGQLIRARRRSEIMQELRSIDKKDD